MKKLLILPLFLLTACTPNVADFKSDVPPLEERAVHQAEKTTEMPAEINLDVPFFPQAPDADWSMPWQEACEEAASVLAYYYVSDQTLDKETFKEEVLALVEWQKEHFGGYEHSNIEQTAMMIKSHFLEPSSTSVDMVLIEEPSVKELKEFIADGYVVIAPFAGRQLGNPFYTGEGPLYHMMVIKGYDKEHFITNDVGTKRGENFIYSYETIMSAMHEWHETDIGLGAKKVIILK